MSVHTAGVTASGAKARSSMGSDAAKLFYPAASLILLVSVLWGFSQYWFNGGRGAGGREIAPPMKTLVLVHGSVMAAWTLLFVLQPMLVLAGKRKVHMLVGKAGVALAVGVVVLGTMVGVISARHTPVEVRIWGLSPERFLAVPLSGVLTFAALVAIGIAYRRKPAVHRAMMLCATLSVCTAAISRIAPLSDLYIGTFLETAFGPFFMMAVLGVALLLVRCALIRGIDRPLAWGTAALIGLSLATMALIRSGGWDAISPMFMR